MAKFWAVKFFNFLLIFIVVNMVCVCDSNTFSPWTIETAVWGTVSFELSFLTRFPYLYWSWSGIIFKTYTVWQVMCSHLP